MDKILAARDLIQAKKNLKNAIKKLSIAEEYRDVAKLKNALSVIERILIQVRS